MKKYKLDLTLIERTKLLEGILCQTLTFTNANGKQWGNGDIQNPVSALTFFDHTEVSDKMTTTFDNDIKQLVKNLYVTPEKSGETFQILRAAGDIGEVIDNYLNQLYGPNTFTTIATTSSLTYVTPDVKEIVNSGMQGATIVLSAWVGIQYNLIIHSELNGVLQTDKFNIQYYIAGVENRYPLKPYSITDCICRCLELAEPLTLGQVPRYKLQGVTYNFNDDGIFTRTYEPNSQAEKYDKITAPNFTMTQCTLREQLKVIGGYIHAEPRLGYRIDGIGATPETYEENTIVFEQYEKEETTNLGEHGYVYRGVSQSLNDYCTSITTNVSNVVNTINYDIGAIKDPASNAFKTVRTDSVNVMITESNAKIQTQLPIYDIIEVLCTIFSNGQSIREYDITPYVFEQHEYNNLSSYEGTYPYAKSYAIYYTQGQKGLDGLFFKNEAAESSVFLNYAIKNIIDSVSGNDDFDSANDYQKIGFRVTYIPIFSTMFSHGKSLIQDGNNNFTIPYSQSENLVESSFYGENIKGVANRMGNVAEERTFIVPDITYIPKAGQVMKTNSGDMVISRVSRDMRHTHFKVTVALTKDFNRISQYVGVNSRKRISEVSEKEAYSRNILIKEYAVIGEKDPQKKTPIFEFEEAVECSIIGNRDGKIAPVTTVLAAGAKKRYFKTETEKRDEVEYETGVSLPVVTSAFGNSIVFSWAYKDNYSAFERIQKFIDLTQNNKSEKAAYQIDVPYGDYYGRFYWYDFALLSHIDSLDKPVEYEELLYANGVTAGTGIIGFPDSGYSDAVIRTSEYQREKLNPIMVQKDSREVLNVNFEVEFVSNRNDLILGSAIASKCPLVSYQKDQAIVYFFAGGCKFNKYPRYLDFSEKFGDFIVHLAVIPEPEYSNVFSFDIPDVEFDSWCIAYPSTTKSNTYSDENGETTVISTQIGGEITIACNNNSGYYKNNDKTKEEIWIHITDTNLKGV